MRHAIGGLMRRTFVPALALAVLAVASPLPAVNFTVRAEVTDPDQVVWFATDIERNPQRNTATPFHVVAQNSDYQQVASYRGIVHFTADDASVDLPPDYTFTAADAGAH